jgi:hypothetical protein
MSPLLGHRPSLWITHKENVYLYAYVYVYEEDVKIRNIHKNFALFYFNVLEKILVIEIYLFNETRYLLIFVKIQYLFSGA